MICVTLGSLQFDTIPYRALSTCGFPYERRARIGMPRIPREVLGCTFFLFENRDDAERGDDPCGTGFLVGIPSNVSPRLADTHFYAVTNWHVAVRGGASVIKLYTQEGVPEDIREFDPSEWIFDPLGEDVAIMPIDLDAATHSAMMISTDLFATKDWIAEHEIGVGDDIFMLGLFVDHALRTTRLPKARFGNISMMPSRRAPIENPLGKTTPSFILDMHSRSGFSGSPVFVYRTVGSDLTMDGIGGMRLDTPTLFRFLGIHWGPFPEELKAKDDAGKKYTIRGVSGMTCATPAWRIADLLQIDEFRDKRIEREKMQSKDKKITSAPVAEISASRSSDENPSHREDFKSLLTKAAKTPSRDD